MAERKKTPNILADLLGDQPQNSPSKNTVSQQAVLPVKQQNGLPVTSVEKDEADVTNEAAPKVKVTFYLSEASVDLLEEAQRTLRRMSRGNGKTSSKAMISKSALLEAALQMACADLENRNEESQLAHMLF